MLELAVLGLLQKEPLHGYRLKQQLEVFMSGCISANYGAIYPLLKRLEEQEVIQVVEDDTGGSTRKIYSITQKGKALWKQQMLEHPQESWVYARSRFMIKFFFFSHLVPQDRVQLLEHRLMVCRLRLENQNLQFLPDDIYQATAWERHREMVEHEIKWLCDRLDWEKLTLHESTNKAHIF
ncbi:PadR family transcriptional regulator [Candidatus Gracilibacteria bacterium]|nr:PadR family transcriptional regulator [Candidatus Gracilibacteria bacterium]NJM86830.1 PadR family transcriptional regulator [Hydrococcus sp. RU_2_2]NJP17862.1 PadR family transcriptional regulator [Hydrococcus sp. CRU_1_1]